jgi:hypothetical protein
MLKIDIIPKRQAMPDPVLSDDPPSTEVTLTPLSCKEATYPNQQKKYVSVLKRQRVQNVTRNNQTSAFNKTI